MDNELQQLGVPRVVKECYGVLNGETLTVAAKIVDWGNMPIPGLTINPTFHSGNHVPVGTIKVSNDFYDETTGFYWFDVKVNPLNCKAHFAFETTASVEEVTGPIKFCLDVSGQSKTEITGVEFIGRDLYYNVAPKPGHSVFKHPLETKATVNLSDLQSRFTNNPGVDYLWGCPIAGQDGEIRALGNVMVDGVTEPYLFRHTLTSPEILSVSATQTNANTLNVKVTLDKPFGEKLLVNGFASYTEDPEFGRCIISGGKNPTINGNEASFDIRIWEVKKKGLVDVELVINIGDEVNTPVVVDIPTSVTAWTDGEKTINVVKVAHTVTAGKQTLVGRVEWKGSKQPVENFKVLPNEDNVNVVIKKDHFFLTRSVEVNKDHQNTFTLSGKVDLGEYGITRKTNFSESIDVGSDIVPIKIAGSQCNIVEDKGLFILALRNNNGSIPTDVVLEKLQVLQGSPFSNLFSEVNYDGNTGYLQFKLPIPLDKITYPEVLAKAKLQLSVLNGDTATEGYVVLDSKAKVDYKVFPLYRQTRYEQKGEGYLAISEWQVVDNNGGFPKAVSLMQFKVNGKNVSSSKFYNQSNGTLTVKYDVPVLPESVVHLSATISATGLNYFVQLSDVVFTFYKPGTAKLIKCELNPERTRVTVQWAVRGWDTSIPHDVVVNPDTWVVISGVNTKGIYTDYDNFRGILTCGFNVQNKDLTEFHARNTIRIGKSDGTEYPLTF